MSYSRNVPAGLIAVGFQAITTNSTAQTLNTTAGTKATCLRMSVETQSIRIRFDGTAPTQNTGVLFTAGNYYLDSLPSPATDMKIIKVAAGAATVNIQTFKHPSDK